MDDDIIEFVIAQDRKYSMDHLWFQQKDQKLMIGVSEFLRVEIGDVLRVILPQAETEIDEGGSLFSLWTADEKVSLTSPFSGVISDVNGEVEISPDLVNDSAYNDGWIILLEPHELLEFLDLDLEDLHRLVQLAQLLVLLLHQRLQALVAASGRLEARHRRVGGPQEGVTREAPQRRRWADAAAMDVVRPQPVAGRVALLVARPIERVVLDDDAVAHVEAEDGAGPLDVILGDAHALDAVRLEDARRAALARARLAYDVAHELEPARTVEHKGRAHTRLLEAHGRGMWETASEAQLEAMTLCVDSLTRSRLDEGDFVWRTTARDHLKTLLSQERFAEGHAVLGLMHEGGLWDNAKELAKSVGPKMEQASERASPR